jgi:hypothetical protein
VESRKMSQSSSLMSHSTSHGALSTVIPNLLPPTSPHSKTCNLSHFTLSDQFMDKLREASYLRRLAFPPSSLSWRPYTLTAELQFLDELVPPFLMQVIT